MRRTLLYALLFAVPPGVAAASGVHILGNRPDLGLLFGLAVGGGVFALVVLGREYGSVDESRTGP